jgi:hypothetical protein
MLGLEFGEFDGLVEQRFVGDDATRLDALVEAQRNKEYG